MFCDAIFVKWFYRVFNAGLDTDYMVLNYPFAFAKYSLSV